MIFPAGDWWGSVEWQGELEKLTFQELILWFKSEARSSQLNYQIWRIHGDAEEWGCSKPKGLQEHDGICSWWFLHNESLPREWAISPICASLQYAGCRKADWHSKHTPPYYLTHRPFRTNKFIFFVWYMKGKMEKEKLFLKCGTFPRRGSQAQRTLSSITLQSGSSILMGVIGHIIQVDWKPRNFLHSWIWTWFSVPFQKAAFSERPETLGGAFY